MNYSHEPLNWLLRTVFTPLESVFYDFWKWRRGLRCRLAGHHYAPAMAHRGLDWHWREQCVRCGALGRRMERDDEGRLRTVG